MPRIPELEYQLGRFMGGRGPFLNRAQRQAQEKVRQQQQSFLAHQRGEHAHVNNYDPDCSECAKLTLAEHAAQYSFFHNPPRNECPRVEQRMECPECGYPFSEAMVGLDESVPHVGPVVPPMETTAGQVCPWPQIGLV